MAAIDLQTRLRLEQLGYLSKHDTGDHATEAGVLRFQQNHGDLFTGSVQGFHGRVPAGDGSWGQVSQKLLDMPRDCSCPDITRDADGNEIAEARWPEDCALELEFSCNFLDRGMPGLTPAQTRQSILFALAELNVMFDSPLNGTIHGPLMQEFLRLGGDVSELLFVLSVGTFKHEVMHAMGGRHTPSDPDSVLYPSMRGQYLLNRTDIGNFLGLGYSKVRPLRNKLADWDGRNGTHIWATLGALPGSTLAWSMLATGSCGQRAEQRYDSLVTWNKTKINLPPKPSDPKVVAIFRAKEAGQEFSVVTGKKNGGGNGGGWW